MAIEVLGGKKTVILGYNDVLIGVKVVDEVGLVTLFDYPEGYGTKGGTVVEEPVNLIPLSFLRFDNIRGLGLLIDQLEFLEQKMEERELEALFKNVKDNTEFPTLI